MANQKKPNTEFETYVKAQTFISSDFMEHGFRFWFDKNNHIRSPFPQEIRKEIEENTFKTFLEWTWGLTEKEKREMKDEELIEMFEVVLFNEAMKIVETDDQRLTIAYPFMPRLGDTVKDEVHGYGIIKERKPIVTKDDKKLIELTITSDVSEKTWKTEFELPA